MSHTTLWRFLVLTGAIALIYFFVAKLTLATMGLGAEASPLWPPAGIGLAALLWRRSTWLGVALGLLLVNRSMDVPWLLSSGSALSNTLQALIGALLLSRFHFRVNMERLRDVLIFIGLAVLATPLVNATLGSWLAYLVDYLNWQQVGQNWWTVWLGDGMGILVFTPLLILLFRKVHRIQARLSLWQQPSSPQVIEEFLWLGLLITTSWLVFHSRTDVAIAQYPLEYLPFPFVVWAALRFGQSNAVLASFVLSIVAIGGTVSGYGPFVAKAQDPRQIVLLLQAFLGVVTMTALILAAVMTERQRAEALLRQSEASLANAQRLAHLGNWDFDFQENRWCWSEEMYRLLGFAPQETTPCRETFLQMVHPADRERVRQMVSEALEQRHPCQLDYRIVLPDGSERIVGEQVVVGETNAIGTVQDITDRKRAEEQLRLTAERNRLLSEMALRIRQSLDLDETLNTTVEEVRRFLQADRVFISCFNADGYGCVMAESVLPNWKSVMGSTSDPAMYAEIQAIFEHQPMCVVNDTAQGEPPPMLKQYQQVYQVRAGIAIPIMLSPSPTPCAGDPKTALQGSSQGGWSDRPDCYSTNSTSIAAPVAYSQSSSSLCAPAPLPPCPPARLFGVLVVHQCSAPRRWQPMEIELLEQLATQVTIALQQGQLYRRVQSLNANLEQQVAERTLQLQENMAALEELSQLQDVFLYAIAHDLRTTVMGTLMVLQNLQRQEGDTISIPRSLLQRMTQSGEVQLTKLNALLEAYTVKTEGVILQREKVSLDSVLQAAIEEVNPLFEQNRAELIELVAADLPPVAADPIQLQRVFNHLLLNAVKHNPPNVQVKIQVTMEAGMLRCTVEDNGKGINPSQCNRLFDLRAGGTEDRQLGGIRLGLYLCHEIIQAHGGKFGVNSTPGEGSCFWFTLPRWEANVLSC